MAAQRGWSIEETANKLLEVSAKARSVRLSWKWRKRSSVKITGRTHEEATEALHARREGRQASAGGSGRAGWEIGGGEGTAEESPPAGRVTDKTDYFRLAD